MVYKCLKNLTPGYLHGSFQYRAKTHQRVTRRNNDLTLPRYRLVTGQKTFTYRGAKLYNSMAKDSSLFCFILFYFNSCMYDGRAPKGELCNKVCMYVICIEMS